MTLPIARAWGKMGAPNPIPTVDGLLAATAQVHGLAVFPDGTTIVSAGGDNSLRLWDVPQPDPLLLFDPHPAAVRRVAVSPDGQRLLSASDDKTARLYLLDAAEPAAALSGHAGAVTSGVFRSDNNQVARRNR